MKKYFFIALCLAMLFAFVPTSVSAVTSASDHVFNSVDIRMEIDENKIVTVYETIETEFLYSNTVEVLGREISCFQNTVNAVTPVKDMRVQIDGVNAEYKFGRNGANYEVLVYPNGDYFNGKHTVSFSYIIDKSDEIVSGMDSFLFNFREYDLKKVKKLDAKLTFPKSISNCKLEFYDSKDNSVNVNYTIRESELVFSAKGAELAGGLQMNAVLSNGYFAKNKPEFFGFYIIFALLSAVAIIATIIIFLTNSRQRPKYIQMEYPPENVDPYAMQYILKGGANKKAVVALLLDFEAKGYLGIRCENEQVILQKKSEANGPATEVFNAIFSSSTEVVLLRSSQDLQDRLRNQNVNEALQKYHLRLEKEKSIESTSHKVLGIFPFLAGFPMAMLLLFVMFYTHSWFISPILIFMYAGTYIGFLLRRGNPIIYPFCLIFTFVPFLAILVGSYNIMYDYSGLLPISVIFWLAAFIASYFLGRRSDSAQKQYCESYSFALFAKTASADTVYEAKLLPYAWLFGGRIYSSQEWNEENLKQFAELIPFKCAQQRSSRKKGRS